MTAIEYLTALSPVDLDPTKAAKYIEIAATFVSLYTIPDNRIELAKAFYAGHLLAQAGILKDVVSQSFDGGSVSFQGANLGDKEGASTWFQEFSKLVPDFHSPQVIL